MSPFQGVINRRHQPVKVLIRAEQFGKVQNDVQINPMIGGKVFQIFGARVISVLFVDIFHVVVSRLVFPGHALGLGVNKWAARGIGQRIDRLHQFNRQL